MKNIHTLLTEHGIEIPAEKKSTFDTAFNENYKTVEEVNKLRTGRDNLQKQLDTVSESLKQFEGVDLNELNGKITALTNDLAAQKTAYEQQIADMEFTSLLDAAISKAGARSIKAVRSELDIEALKASKNRDTDIEQAISSCKEENGFLFGADEPINNPIVGSGGSSGGGNELSAIRAAMGLS